MRTQDYENCTYNHRVTTKQVTDELVDVGEKVSQWTDGRILERRRLKACCPRQTVLLQPQHLKVCFMFTKDHTDINFGRK